MSIFYFLFVLSTSTFHVTRKLRLAAEQCGQLQLVDSCNNEMQIIADLLKKFSEETRVHFFHLRNLPTIQPKLTYIVFHSSYPFPPTGVSDDVGILTITL